MRSPGRGSSRLLNGARWDADELRDDLQYYVAERLGEPYGILVLDDTGCAPRGAEDSSGRENPPLVIAVTG
ncbi:hypothetical protein [Streptomyces sp. NPDC005799]|uniref:hypothetical protein n=1 Tax=Streptomyces sp. NPDC005799 TaxID=3154678 RepID=UPI0033C58F58